MLMLCVMFQGGDADANVVVQIVAECDAVCGDSG